MADQSKPESGKQETYDYIEAQETALKRTVEAVRASNAQHAEEVAQAKAAEEAKKTETPKEPAAKPEPASTQTEETPASSKPEPKPEEDKGLNKTWPTVMRVDRENRELRKTVAELRKNSEELEEAKQRLQDFKDTETLLLKLKTDPYTLLEELKLDPDTWIKRRANKGKPTVDERIEQVEQVTRQVVEDREHQEAETAYNNYKSGIAEVYESVDEALRSKFTLEEVLETASLHFESTHDILEPDDAVRATLTSKGLTSKPESEANKDKGKEKPGDAPSKQAKPSEKTLTSSWSEPRPLFSDDEEDRFQRAMRLIRNK